ncbi:kinase-like domain-containing protein [Rhizophagus irregularis DAOM 181602=DAOM 197198]|nr:kinase-like domain-containing protein [Rhizophagus irregularis DAOM 181602=DAOM 197198]
MRLKCIQQNIMHFLHLYSAIWKDGPLFYNNWYNEYTRDPNKKVALKYYFHNSQNSIDFLINKINEVKKYSTKRFNRVIWDVYGLSQNPNTNNYILVLEWASGNEKIDDFIQEMQLKRNSHNDIIFEWIPHDQLDEIEEIGKSPITVHSAIWNNGPLFYSNLDKRYMRESNTNVALKHLHSSQNSIEILISELKKHLTSIFGRKYKHYTRDSSIEVALRCLHNSEDSIDSLINEAKKYLPKKVAFAILYGISQNPDTNDYILDGPLYYDDWDLRYTRKSRKVVLKYLYNSLNSVDSLINEAKKYLTDDIYGISQNPNTNNYILVLVK